MATFSSCPANSSSLLQLKSSSSKILCASSSFASIVKPSSSSSYGCMRRHGHEKKFQRMRSTASTTLEAPQTEEIRESSLPKWSEFELGLAPIYWKTENGLPPASGESLTLFYNPAASKLVPNEQYGIAFNGGFNQPIMCGGEPRGMTRKDRGIADAPYYTIKIRVPRYAVNLIFSFTNGEEWDGPYKLQFQVLKMWRNQPISFFNEGLVEELSVEGACDKAIYPDSNAILSCAIGNLYVKGGESCKLNLVTGCMDPNSPLYDPLANVDDGSCPIDTDSDEE